MARKTTAADVHAARNALLFGYRNSLGEEVVGVQVEALNMLHRHYVWKLQDSRANDADRKKYREKISKIRKLREGLEECLEEFGS